MHPTAPAQVVVSYFQAGRICDYINNKWGWDTLLAMLHDFSGDVNTPDVIRKELKIEPDAFDKEFLAWLEADTKKQVQNFEEWRSKMRELSVAASKKDNDTVIKDGPAVRDLFPDFVEAGSAYELLAGAYVAKGNKPAAIDELLRYVHAGGRTPDSIMQLGKLLVEANRKKEAVRRSGAIERHLSRSRRPASPVRQSALRSGRRPGSHPRIQERWWPPTPSTRHRLTTTWRAPTI